MPNYHHWLLLQFAQNELEIMESLSFWSWCCCPHNNRPTPLGKKRQQAFYHLSMDNLKEHHKWISHFIQYCAPLNVNVNFAMLQNRVFDQQRCTTNDLAFLFYQNFLFLWSIVWQRKSNAQHGSKWTHLTCYRRANLEAHQHLAMYRNPQTGIFASKLLYPILHSRVFTNALTRCEKGLITIERNSWTSI